MVRHMLCKSYGLSKSFALSHKYVYFWNKLERANVFLEYVLRTPTRPEPEEGDADRPEEHMVSHCVDDGGGWHSPQILEKYGAVPECVYPSLHHGKDSKQLRNHLKRIVVQCALDMRIIMQQQQRHRAVEAGSGGVSQSVMRKAVERKLEDCASCLWLCAGFSDGLLMASSSCSQKSEGRRLCSAGNRQDMGVAPQSVSISQLTNVGTMGERNNRFPLQRAPSKAAGETHVRV